MPPDGSDTDNGFGKAGSTGERSVTLDREAVDCADSVEFVAHNGAPDGSCNGEPCATGDIGGGAGVNGTGGCANGVAGAMAGAAAPTKANDDGSRVSMASASGALDVESKRRNGDGPALPLVMTKPGGRSCECAAFG